VAGTPAAGTAADMPEEDDERSNSFDHDKPE
jgi:hypothetical protein